MIRERIVGTALLAYPPEVRDSRGGEMADTVLDVSSGSSWRVLGESLALVRSGLRARASIAAGSGGRRLAATVCAQGATVWGLVVLIGLLRFDRMMIDSPPTALEHEATYVLIQVLLLLATAAALVGYDRIAALFGLAWIGLELRRDFTAPSWTGGASPERIHSVALVLVPLICYGVMLLVPRARRRDLRRLLWLLAALLAGLAPPIASTNFGYGLGPEGFVLLLLLGAGVFLLPAGPSLPLAFAVALIAHGLSLWTRPSGFGLTEFHDVRWAMTTAGPLLLGGGAALRVASARRGVAG